MPINNEEQLHGAAFLRLFEEMSVQAPEIKLSVSNLLGRNFYLVTAAKPGFLGKWKSTSFGIVIKISNKRRSPWRYTYTKDNQDELAAIFRENGEVFSIYVAGEDGFACLSHKQLKEVLDENHEEVEWVSISRRLRENYRVAGTDGRREQTLAGNSFPQKIIEHIISTIG